MSGEQNPQSVGINAIAVVVGEKLARSLASERRTTCTDALQPHDGDHDCKELRFVCTIYCCSWELESQYSGLAATQSVADASAASATPVRLNGRQHTRCDSAGSDTVDAVR